MLARFLWPVQAACQRWSRSVLALATALAAVGLVMGWRCRPPDSAWPAGGAAALLFMALAIAEVAESPWLRLWIGAAVSVAAGLGAGLLAGIDPSLLPLLAGACCVTLLPLVAAIAGTSTIDALPSAITRGTSQLAITGQLALVAMLPFGWPGVIGTAVASLSSIAVLAAATTRVRLPAAAHPGQARALAAEVRPRRRAVLWARAMLAALGVIALGHHWDLVGRDWLAPALLALIWAMSTARPLMAFLIIALGHAVAAQATALATHAGLQPPQDRAAAGAAALGIAQALPVMAWSASEHARRLRPLHVGALVAIILAASAALGVAPAALAAAATGWAVVHSWERWKLPASRTGGGLASAMRVHDGLAPYGRFYARAKLRFDPVYGQLAHETVPWGRVLDAGCGPGLTAALAAARADVTAYCGIDLDEDKLVVARRVLLASGHALDDRWQLLKGALPLPQALPPRFDTALALDVLHYWPEERQRELLAQLRGALCAGGRLFVREGVVDAGGSAGRVGAAERFTTRFGLNPSTGQLCFLPRERIEALLAEAGFRIEESSASGAENRLWRCVVDEAATPAAVTT